MLDAARRVRPQAPRPVEQVRHAHLRRRRCARRVRVRLPPDPVTGSRSRLWPHDRQQTAAAGARDKPQVWGGWITARRSSVRTNSPAPVTITSASTSSTATSTTPTWRRSCAEWSTSRSPPRSGCPRRLPHDRTCARRRCRRDHRRDGRPSRTGRRGGGRNPIRAPRNPELRPLRASLGIDPVALPIESAWFAMIETAAGLDAVADICAVPVWPRLRRSRGPGDLLGDEVVKATSRPKVRDAIVPRTTGAAAAGSLRGIHAGDGNTGKELAALGFQLITLAPESQALRRGAIAHTRRSRGRG